MWDILRLPSSHRAALGLYVILTLWQTRGANQQPYALLHIGARRAMHYATLFWQLTSNVSFYTIPWGSKVSMLTNTYPHKPMRKIKVTICNHQVEVSFYLWPSICSGDLQAKNSEWSYTTPECPYWDQVSKNNTKLKLIYFTCLTCSFVELRARYSPCT